MTSLVLDTFESRHRDAEYVGLSRATEAAYSRWAASTTEWQRVWERSSELWRAYQALSNELRRRETGSVASLIPSTPTQPG